MKNKLKIVFALLLCMSIVFCACSTNNSTLSKTAELTLTEESELSENAQDILIQDSTDFEKNNGAEELVFPFTAFYHNGFSKDSLFG